MNLERVSKALNHSIHVLVGGLPMPLTSRDLRRAIAKADIRGVADVSLFYRVGRQTDRAILIMSSPDYTQDAVRDVKKLILPGILTDSPLRAELVGNPTAFLAKKIGDGLSANARVFETVSIAGFPGRTTAEIVTEYVREFRLARDIQEPVVKLDLAKGGFSLYSHFIIFLESESEAYRFVRRFHMTKYKDMAILPELRAEVIV